MTVSHLPRPSFAILLIAGGLALSAPAVAAIDEDGAMNMARQQGCFKCHPIDKRISKDEGKKDGPPWREVAKKYKGKPDAEAQLTTHVTTGRKVKFPDGHEENHKIIKTDDAKELKNLVQWILSL